MEVNRIFDRELKEDIGNAAVRVLIENDLISEDELKYLKISIGYLFTTNSGQIEALFNVTCMDKEFYFAVQNGGFMRINIDRDSYDATVSLMKSTHACLQSSEPSESGTQKIRREKNNSIIRSKGISVSEKLLCLLDDDRVTLRSTEEICKRAAACLLTIQIACDINNNGDYEGSLEFFKPLYTRYGVEDMLNSKEKRIIDGTYSTQDTIDMDWAYEAYWALCWCLGLVEDISGADTLCDCQEAISFLTSSQSLEDFIGKCKLRSLDEILDMQDLYYRYHWAVNDSIVNPDCKTGDLNRSVVIERRRALEWVLSSTIDWYDIVLSA